MPERTREPRGDRHRLEIRIDGDRRRRTVHELTLSGVIERIEERKGEEGGRR